jgi:hypothetical protein
MTVTTTSTTKETIPWANLTSFHARMREHGGDALETSLKQVIDRVCLTLPRETVPDQMRLATLVKQLESAFWQGAAAERERCEAFFKLESERDQSFAHVLSHDSPAVVASWSVNE